MKEKTTIILLIISFSIIAILLFQNENKTKSEVFKPNFSFPFYKKEKKNEYLDYKNKTGLSLKESIIRVNIGLNHDFYTNTKPAKEEGIFTLVNKYNYVTKNYLPKDLIEVNNLKISKEAYEAYLNMKEDMEKEGLSIRIISAYRTYEYQENLYNNYLKYESKNLVDTYSARAGYSEHHTGLAIDVDNKKLNFNKFYLTKEFIWMQENSYKYGFILRYPKDKEDITGYTYEPWHYRYIGKEIAEYIKKHNSTYEEYYYEFVDI